MWIKKTKSRGIEYFQIVNSIRVGNKVKHNVVLNLGRGDKLFEKKQEIKDLAEKLLALVGENKETDTLGMGIYNYGYLIYKKIFEELYLERLLIKLRRHYQEIQFDIVNCILLLIIEHIFISKNLHFYRIKDFSHEEKLKSLELVGLNKQELDNFLSVENLSEMNLTRIYVNITCYNEYNDTVVLLSEGNFLPIGIFNYNTEANLELKLRNLIDNLKKKYRQSLFTLIADQEQCEVDLFKLTNYFDKYVIHCKKDQLNDDVKNELFLTKDREELHNFYQSLNNRNLYFSYSERRAKKSAKEREKLLLRIKKTSIKVLENSINIDKRFDGLSAFLVNNDNISEAISKYHTILRMEETFRNFRADTSLKLTTNEEVQGHTSLCFLTLYIVKILEKRLKDIGLNIALNELLDILGECNLLEYHDGAHKQTKLEIITNQKSQLLSRLITIEGSDIYVDFKK